MVRRSNRLPWYAGPSLLEHLEGVPATLEVATAAPRFQVQYVIRPQTAELPDYRGYAGQIQSGQYRRGDRVQVLPSGLESVLEAIEVNQQAVETAAAPQAVVLHLRDDVAVSRGDAIIPVNHVPTLTRELEATLCWMSEQPLWPGRKLLLQHHSAVVKATIPTILHKVNVQTFARVATDSAQLNDIVRVRLKTAVPLAVDNYHENRVTGAFILVDEQSGDTIAAGLIGAANADYFTAPVAPPVAFSI